MSGLPVTGAHTKTGRQTLALPHALLKVILLSLAWFDPPWSNKNCYTPAAFEPKLPISPRPVSSLQKSSYKPKDGSDPMRIVYTIVIHGPMAKPFVDDLIVMLKHENPEVRRAAAWGVPRMFADDKPVIAALREALGDAETAEEAARSLKMLEEARK